MMKPKSMSDISDNDAAFRAQAEAKARNLEPMTEAEIASLPIMLLTELHDLAKGRRLFLDHKNTQTEAEFNAFRVARALESMAWAELEARKGQRVADGTLRTLAAIGKTLFGGEAA